MGIFAILTSNVSMYRVSMYQNLQNIHTNTNLFQWNILNSTHWQLLYKLVISWDDWFSLNFSMILMSYSEENGYTDSPSQYQCKASQYMKKNPVHNNNKYIDTKFYFLVRSLCISLWSSYLIQMSMVIRPPIPIHR